MIPHTETENSPSLFDELIVYYNLERKGKKQNSVYSWKITNGAENACLSVKKTIAELLCKFYSIFKMGNCPLQIAKDKYNCAENFIIFEVITQHFSWTKMLLMFLNQTETSLKQQEVQSSALSVIIGIDKHLSKHYDQ